MSMCQMSGRRRTAVLIGSLTAVFASLFVLFVAHSAPEKAIEAIKVVLDKQEADWNKGDLDAFLGGYWRDPGVVFQSGGTKNVGFEAMRDRYQKRYKADGKAMGKVAFSKVEIIPLGDDSAMVRGGWGLTMPDGTTPGGLFTLIFRKFDDEWKIVHDHTSSAEPPAKPTLATPGF